MEAYSQQQSFIVWIQDRRIDSVREMRTELGRETARNEDSLVVIYVRRDMSVAGML
jgi:hypothetical protein